MTVYELLAELRARKVRLWVKDGSLCFSAPKDALDPEIKGRMGAHKAALIDILGGSGGEGEVASEAAQGEARSLSFAQERLLFLHRMDSESSAYNVPLALRIRGRLDPDALEAAFDAVIGRHEALRSRFVSEGAEFRCAIADDISFRLERISLRAVAASEREEALIRLADREAVTLFDLECAPLLRATLVELGDEDQALLISMHHLVSDGWSIEIILNDLWEAYSGGTLPAAPAYSEYVAEQGRWLRGQAFDRQKDYWIDRLAGLPDLLELPTDRPRPPVQLYEGAVERFEIPATLVEALERLGTPTGTSLYMVLAAALSALLGRYSGQRDIAIGTPVANRPARKWEDAVGFFSNVVVLRTDLEPGISGRGLLERVRDAGLGALEHQEFPFEQVVEHLQPRRSLSHSPLFQVMFIYKEAAAGAAADGLDVAAMAPRSQVAKFDITLTVAREASGGASAGFEYSTALFDASTMRRMGAHFVRLLEQLTARPDVPIESLDLIDEAEYRAEAEAWNASATRYADNRLVHELIEEQALRIPEAVAASFEGEEIGYGRLVERGRALAAALHAAGVGPEAKVGLYADRSLDLLVGLLGILQSGGAYVPLDPNYPAARIDAIRDDAGLQAIVTTSGLAPRLGSDLPLLCLDRLGESEFAGAALPQASAENLAYVIYTSGSTGTPKGVMVSHRNVVNFFAGLDRALAPVLPKDPQSGRPVWMALTSISFDISVLELLWTLARGHHVVLQKDHLSALAAQAAAGDAQTVRLAEAAVAGRPAPDFSLFYFASDEDGQTDKYRLLMQGARFADASGFAALWVPERHFHAFGGQFANPSVAAAAVAAITNRIQVRAGSCVLPLHDPLRVAEEWSMVDNLSHGRAGVAFASGWHFNDFVLKPDNFQGRHKIMRDGIDTVRHLWAGGTVRRHDGLGNEVDIGIRPRPVQVALPIWITSAASPDTFRYAGEIGANVLTHLLGQSLAELAEKIAIYRQARRDNGHDPEAGKVTLMLHTFVGSDLEKVRDAVREPFKNYLRTSINLLRPVAEANGLDAAGDLELVVDAGFNRYFATSALFGTPESCLKLVDDVVGIGVDEIACLIDFGVDSDLVIDNFDQLGRLRELTAQRAALAPARDAAPARCTHIQCTPSFARLLVDQPEAATMLQGLEGFLVGGEALPPALAARLKETLPAQLFNMYGPTETTVWSAVRHVERDEAVIGAPIANTQLHVLDGRGLPVPVGVKGELCIGGDGVSRGYRGRPDMTAERFRPDPFATRPGGRLYRTGDLVRRLEDGTIDFLGRIDGQVKVRGFRVELGEIETLLQADPAVDQAVAIVRGETGTDAAIFAYVSAKAGAALSTADLLETLRTRLPEYMVPSALIELPALPLTPNGKIDRKALPEAAAMRPAAAKELPRNELESRLSEIWCELLKLDSVGINDNFFELGGHSLLLGRLKQMLAERFGRDVGIIELFKYPTIATLTRLFAEPDDGTARARRPDRARSRQEAASKVREQMKARRRNG